MEATEGMKKAIADRKAGQVNSVKRLDAAIKESRASRQTRREEQRRYQ